jgi:hypothetical protein
MVPTLEVMFDVDRQRALDEAQARMKGMSERDKVSVRACAYRLLCADCM